jgi:glycosyltransferase involved in cell wall biosynthesis
MRILYIIGGGEFGGAEQHLLSLVKSLDPTQYKPHVAVFYDAEFAARVRALHVPVTVLGPGKSYLILSGLGEVRRLIRTLRPEIIHTHGVRANLVGRLANRLEGSPCRLITTVHSVLALDYPVAWKRWLFARLEEWTSRYVDHFILVSHAMERDFRRKIPSERISVIHNAIELPAERPVRGGFSSLREELGLPQEAVLVGTVARMHPVKGHIYLIQAIRELAPSFPQVHYVWIGGGELRAELEKQVRLAGLQDVIHFLGVRKDVPALLPQLDLFVLPSISEGLSVAILEAMAAGVPVITTAVGGSPEIVADQVDGILVPAQSPAALAEAIREALSHPERMKKMGLLGQEKVYREFSTERLLAQTTALYRQIGRR